MVEKVSVSVRDFTGRFRCKEDAYSFLTKESLVSSSKVTGTELSEINANKRFHSRPLTSCIHYIKRTFVPFQYLHMCNEAQQVIFCVYRRLCMHGMEPTLSLVSRGGSYSEGHTFEDVMPSCKCYIGIPVWP